MRQKLISIVISFQSSKILPHDIINCCAVFWQLINLKTHESIKQGGLHGLYFSISFSDAPSITVMLNHRIA